MSAKESNEMTAAEKLQAIRLIMQKEGIDAAYLTSCDPHFSEAVAPHYRRVQWLSGFTGGMCLAVVTMDRALFWTDGRYTTQAQREIDGTCFEQLTWGAAGVPTPFEWLSRNLPANSVLGIDGNVCSASDFEKLEAMMQRSGIGIKLAGDLIGAVWPDRPAIPADPVFEMDERFRCESRKNRLERVFGRLKSQYGIENATILNCALDDIGWITNLRGHDHPLYPFFHSFALYNRDGGILFVDTNKVPEDIVRVMAEDGWQIMPREKLLPTLAKLPDGENLVVDKGAVPVALLRSIKPSVNVLNVPSVTALVKACKTPAEQKGMLLANRCEAVALVKLMHWLDNNRELPGLDEYMVTLKLEEFRRQSDLFMHRANIPIIAYGPNAAMPHYRASEKQTSPIKPVGYLLYDVCAQYLCGTTDVTRNVIMGELTDEERFDYTLVLKAHLVLSMMPFPAGTTGDLLDAVVKSTHWRHGCNFGHGTGHGMGYVLNIHEGPAKIITEYAPAFPYGKTTELEPGMIFSNEPGIYKPGRHGVRIENTVCVQEAFENEFGRFYKMQTLTFLPYERDAIIVSMLTDEELDWVNSYHEEVFRVLSPELPEDCREWLKAKTERINR